MIEQPAIFYDHTDTSDSCLNTGIQRVVRQLGHILPKMASNTFVPVVHWKRRFYRMSLRSHPTNPPSTSVRRLARRLGAGPLRAVRKWSNENQMFFRCKVWLWENLEAWSLRRARVWPRANDWYLTADAIWNRPAIFKTLDSLRAAYVRTAIVVYDLTPITHPQWYDRSLVERFVIYAERLASFDVVLCISEVSKQEFLKFCRERGYQVPNKVVTIPLGYEIRESSLPLATRGLQKTPASLDGPFVLCVGTLEPRKNHPTLLDAFDMLWEREANLSLVIVGRPSYGSEEIVSRVEKHVLSGRKLFYFRNCGDAELEDLYRTCSFTVLPSFLEGYGLPVLESLARGKPCVCSDIPVFHQIAGRFGIYFDPHDPSSIAAEIEKLYRDSDRLESSAAAIRSEYSPPRWTDCGQAVLDALGWTLAVS